MFVWRISEYPDLSGRGGELYSGRWNHLGDKIVYCAEHPALAMLEVLVNFDIDELPETLQLLKIKIPDATSIQQAPVDVPDSRDYWQAFLKRNKTCLLQVHSVILPHSFNILINPLHEDAGKIDIESAERFTVDSRFHL